MKKKTIFVLFLMFIILCCFGARLETLQSPNKTLRASVSTDDTAHTTTTSKNANIPSHAYPIPENWNNIQINFTGDTANDEFVAYVYLAKNDGDIFFAWTATITVGAQVGTDTRLYADTFASITDNWSGGVSENDYAGSDRIATITFDAKGFDKVWVLFTGLSSETAAANISGY